MRLLRGLLLAGWLLLMLLAGTLGLAWWLLGTPLGNGFLLAGLRDLTGAQIEVTARQGGLLGPLEWRGLRYEDAFVRVSVQRLRLDWRPTALWRREVAVGDLQLDGVDLRLKPQPERPPDSEPPGSPLTRLPVNLDLRGIALRDFRLWTAGAEEPIEIPRAELVGSWTGDTIALTRFDLDYPGLGRVELQGRARLSQAGVTLDRLSLIRPFPAVAEGLIAYREASSLKLMWQDLRWPFTGAPQLTSARGQASLEGPWSDLRFGLDAALGAEGEVRAGGRWTGELDASLSWTRLGWPLTDAAAPWRSARGSLSVKGVPERYGFDLDADLLARDQAGRVQARGSGSTQSVELAGLTLILGDGRVEAAGPLAWAPQLSGDLRGRIVALDPGLFAADWPGTLNGEFRAAGTLADGRPALDFSLALRDSRLRDYPLKLDAEGRYAGEALDIVRLDLESGRSILAASGRATPPYDVKARLASQNLAEFWPGAGGAARLDAQLRGTLEQPQLVAEGELVRAHWSDFAVAVLQFDARLDWNGPLALALSAKQLSAGTLIDQLKLTVSGQRTAHTLALSATTAQGGAEITLAGGYDERRRRWDGQLANGQLAPRNLAGWTLEEPAVLGIEAQRVDLAPACWASEPGRACLEAHYTPAATRAAFRLEALAFAYFQPLLPPELKVDGSVSGTGTVEVGGGRLRVARAQLSTTQGALRLRDQRFAFHPASLVISDQASQGSARLRLPLETGGIEADATLGSAALFGDRPLSGELRIDFPDLAFLTLLTPEIASAAGRLSGRYQLAGRAGAPELQGEIRLADGAFKLSRPGIELREVSALLTGRPSGQLSLQAQAQSGGGRLEVTGEVEPGPKLMLAVKGSDFQVANLPEARFWASPDLQLRLDGDRADLSGSVRVPRGEALYKQQDSGVAPSEDQVIVDASGKPQEPGDRLELHSNVKLELGGNVRLEAMGLKTRLEGAVTAVDEPGRDTLGYGELRLVDGRYKAYGQDLEIRTGKLLFNGGPIAKPGLEFRAVREPREDILVGITVRGTLAKPQLSLYSEPSMTQQQQLSWLLLGRPLEQTASSDERGMLGSAAVALGLGGGNLLAQRIGGNLGLDEISVGAKPGESADQAMFTVGKYLSPKLFVSYGLGIFQQGQVFRLLYDLGRGFKLSTESGIATGGDLLYTVERP